MQFNSNSDSQDIVSQTLFLCGTDITGYTAKEIARNSNSALSRLTLLALFASGRMSWDDVNHGNQPTATFSLEKDIGTYTIFSATPDAKQNWLSVERIDLLDEDGNGIKLLPIDHQEIPIAMSEFQDVASIPRYFDIKGNELILYPAPNYDKSAGCTIYFNRAPSYFASTDTTKQAGFSSIFDDYITKYNAMMWFFAHDMLTRYDRLRLELKGNDPKKLGGMELDISTYYGSRNKYERPKMTRRRRNYV